MANDSLYNIISNYTGGNQNKRLVGYSTGAYAGVLEGLEKAGMITKSGNSSNTNEALLSGNQPQVTVESRSWTTLANYKINTKESLTDGFYNTDKNQAQVRFNTYMSFFVDVQTDSGKFSKEVAKMPYKISDHDGISIEGGNFIHYPTTDYTKDANESCKNGTASKGGFVIGLGVSFDNFLVKYFKHFYGEMAWDATKLESLAGSGYLIGEIMIPELGQSGESVNSKVIHAKVTVKTNTTTDSSNYDIYVPSPLILLDDFNAIGNIKVTVSSSEDWKKDFLVDGSSVKFPFSSKKYDHKKGIINDFSPSDVESYLSNDSSVSVQNVQSSLCNVNGRARFYFLEEASDAIIKIVGEIPEKYKENMFKGVVKSGDVYRTETIVKTVGVLDAGEVGEYWEKIGQLLANPLSGAKVNAAVDVVGKYESSGNWGMWNICGAGDGDGEGISAGKFQFTQRAGGIKLYKQMFLARGGVMSDGFKVAIDNSRSGGSKIKKLETEGLYAYKSEFADQANTIEGKLSQLDVWKHEKGDKTIECYNLLNCSTAAEFASIFGAVNHHPLIKSDYMKWKSIIQSKTTVEDRIKCIENCHWAAIANYHYNENVGPDDINESYIRSLSSTFGKGWANRYRNSLNDYKNLT